MSPFSQWGAEAARATPELLLLSSSSSLLYADTPFLCSVNACDTENITRMVLAGLLSRVKAIHANAQKWAPSKRSMSTSATPLVTLVTVRSDH